MKKNARNIFLMGLLWLAPIPCIFFIFHFLFNLEQLEQIEQEIQRIQLKTVQWEETKRKENALFTSLKNPDPHYLDKHIETLTFLMPEIKKLEAIQRENPDNEAIAKRLQFLKSSSNRLVFSEEQIRSKGSYREVEEKQQHAVEMNEEDLKKLLCLIEGVTIWPYGPKEGRPQLIIKDFILSKKELFNQEKVYVVSLQLLKRENLEMSK